MKPPAAAPASADDRSTSSAARLVADIEAWEKTVVVNQAAPGRGLAGTEMTVDGSPIWPPQGPRCAELVACCEGFVGDDDRTRGIQLACQLAVAKGPDCPRAIDTIETIVSELGAALPASCPAPR